MKRAGLAPCVAAIVLASCSGGARTLPSSAALAALAHPTTAGFMDLYEFGPPPDADQPFGGLLVGLKGDLFGTGVGGGLYTVSGSTKGTVFEISPSGVEKVLYEFQGGNDGETPEAGLVTDNKGNLYGDTAYGGGSAQCPLGCGTVYELSPGKSGYTERIIYAFQGGSDGADPVATLSRANNGVLYGTTSAGGGGTCTQNGPISGCGTVFELKPARPTYRERILHSFNGGRDGESPRGSLIADDAGNLYGTTIFGGTSNASCLPDYDGNTTCGVVFRVTPSGTERILYAFKGPPGDGANSHSALLGTPSGRLFGLTSHGGTSGSAGLGTVFELTRSGLRYQEHVLYNFCSQTYCADGGDPTGDLGLRKDSRGNLYSTTVVGGDYTCGCGTVFKLSALSKYHKLTTLHAFVGTDGGNPHDSVTISHGGVIYGTTFSGGTTTSSCAYGCGVAFKITP